MFLQTNVNSGKSRPVRKVTVTLPPPPAAPAATPPANGLLSSITGMVRRSARIAGLAPGVDVSRKSSGGAGMFHAFPGRDHLVHMNTMRVATSPIVAGHVLDIACRVSHLSKVLCGSVFYEY
jgi:hypothetical protein